MEMTNVDEDSIMEVSSNNRSESDLGIDYADTELPLEPFVKPYEGMKFSSIEDAVKYYTRYAKRAGFSFHMGYNSKSSTSGMIVSKEILCSKDGFRPKKCESEKT
ncbi:hypothetical protein AAZV13_06G199700 [Glycine max]